MAEKTNGLSSPQGGGFHRLPQIPTMSRSVKIAQSKSAKFEAVTEETVDETAVIHIEGTDTVVKISSDGLTQTVELPVPVANSDSQQQEQKTLSTPEKKSRRGRKPAKQGGTPVESRDKELPTSEETLETGSDVNVKVSSDGPSEATEESNPSIKEVNNVPEDKKPRKGRRSTKLESLDSSKESLVSQVTPESGRRRGRGSPKADTVKNLERQMPDRRVPEAGTPKLGPGRKAVKNTPKQESGKKGRKSIPETEVSEKVQEDQKSSVNAVSDEHSPVRMLNSANQDASSKAAAVTPGSERSSVLSELSKVDGSSDKMSVSPPSHHVSNTSARVSEGKKAEQKVAASARKLAVKQSNEDASSYMSGAGRNLPRTVLLRESERPSDAQLARLMEGKTNQYDTSHPIKWRIGDLLWGHVSGHPYWPGMISSDPFSGLFTTMKGGARVSRLYHVQYFGDEAERGWVGEASSMAFEGKQRFMDMGIAQIKATKDRSKKNKLQQAFCPNQRRKAAWDLAVSEAEDAISLDKETRIDKYTFVYEFLPNKQQSKLAQAAKASPSSTSVEKRGVKRKEPLPDADEGSDSEASARKRQRRDTNTPSAGQKPRGREEGSFETYCIKHREYVREDHPEYSGAMVIEALKQQWALMTPQQRLRYKSKFSSSGDAAEPMEVDSPQGSNKRSPRKSRPSLKKLEADGSYGPDDQKRPRRSSPAFLEKDESAVESMEKDFTPEIEAQVRRRQKKSLPVTEDDQSLSETSSSVKSKISNDSDSNSDFQDDYRPRGRPPKTEEDYILEIFKLNNTAPTKKENLCAVCEKNGELVECQGVCQNFFHATCMNVESSSAEQFKCPECLTGEHKCFFCKTADKETKRCTVSQCGKFYHEDCVKKMVNARVEGKGFTCPLHVCATCVADSSRNLKSAKGRLYRCVRCPTAYHAGDFCIAAGSIHLGGYHILCSNHFQPMKNHKHHLRINVSWCFSCSKGGSLVCCETCPAAFHPECVNLTSMPEDAWYCSECVSGKKPLYGDIIWIKIGNYRWWPAEICHPRNVPTNIQEMAHSVGEFPARFFGSHDYYWTHQGRVFLFQEGDRGSKDTSASRGLFKMYYKGVNEATEAFKAWKAAKESKEQIEQEKNDRKPAPFKFIKASVPVGSVQVYKADLSEIPRCECKPDQENPCGSDSECLNRMLMYECNPNVCPAKEACGNQRFQKREYPECTPYRTEARGWGLKTIGDIKKGQFVNEYVGDLIDEEECKRRIQQAHDDNVTNFYMLTVDKNRIIDAGPRGNNSRFMNHSCEPNVETQKWNVNGDVRVGLFALKDISAGSELTFNYNLECLGNEKTKCSCGSENCSGFLGVRPKTQAAVAVERKKREKDGKKKKKRRRLELKKEHEDECFRCGEGGELVMCDKTNCPKVYHLQCLNLAKPPHGKWLCPWHHCDVCGKLAIKLCSECPNSFCQQHEQGVITIIDDNLICAEHTDLIQGLAASTSESTSGQSVSSSSGDSDDSAEHVPSTVKTEEQDMDAADKENQETFVTKDGDTAPPADIEVRVEPPADEIIDVKESNTIAGDAKVDCKIESITTEASVVKMEKGGDAEGSLKSNLKVGSFSPVEKILFQSTVQADGDAAKKRRPKSQGRKKGTVCRTKARYKAQLKTGSASSSPLPGGTSPSLHALNTDSDNDSGGLVIDLPSN